MRARRSGLLWLLAGSAASVGCDRPTRPRSPATASATDTAVAQVGFGVSHNLTVNGVRRAELRADTALFADSTTSLELRRVRLVLYSTTGDSVGAVTAPAATYDLRTRRVTARGGVTMLVAGRRSTAPTAVYDAATGKVTDPAGRQTEARGRAVGARR